MNRLFVTLCKANLCFNPLKSNLHTNGPQLAWAKSDLPKTFVNFNKKVYPPQEIGEEPRPAVSIRFICSRAVNVLVTYFS